MRILIGVLAVVVLAGCVNESPITATSPAAVATFTDDASLDLRSYSLQTLKTRLIDSVIAMFPGDRERADYLKAALNRPDVYRIGISGRPDVQKLAEQIFAIRDTLRTLAAPAPTDLQVSLVTVGIPEQWSYGDASAVLMRTGTIKVSDVILLPENATAGNLAQAVRAFAALDSSAKAAASGGSHIVVSGATVPRDWVAKGRDKVATEVLDDLRRQPSKRTLSVVMRSMQIGIARHSMPDRTVK